MIFQKGSNWNDLDDGLKRGRVAVRRAITVKPPVEGLAPMGKPMFDTAMAIRHKWGVENPPVFTQERDFFYFVPVND
jgi:hypothetical protein